MKPIVIKIGGSTIENLPDTFYQEIGLLMKSRPVVIVHGGGPAINNRLKELDIEPDFHKGLRITTPEIMEVVEQVLAGSLNKKLVRHFYINQVVAAGISGQDGGLLIAEKMDEHIGLVGDIKNVQPAILNVLLDQNIVPVVSPVGLSQSGEPLNINADHAAVHIAKALNASMLFATDVPGVMENGSVLHQLNQEDVTRLKAEGIIIGGMIPKVDSALFAIEAGVDEAVILNGFQSQVIANYFKGKSVGTRFKKKVAQT
ncbi:acetylglutamate kinase [Salisediminibacterium beveridgei]|uniref:Acetylglutamate kinase n=1 Tax=Salisediminibacterium beveridgei TaxID=632773 RepID=A0A1D7QVJ3_9BACI|nr:acetylglutamate kinase [Salisediminibacterium beveridgei]AOM82978.1 Acetylglutamate kinase [Salisediminibacterium beveridgei]